MEQVAKSGGVSCRCCHGERAPVGQYCPVCLRRPGYRVTEGHIRWLMRGPRLRGRGGRLIR